MSFGSLMRLKIFISLEHRGQLRGSTSQLPAFAGTSLSYELPPCFRRNPPWPMDGDIKHSHLGTHRRRYRLIAGPEEPRSA